MQCFRPITLAYAKNPDKSKSYSSFVRGVKKNKIKDVKLWFNKSKGMSKDIFSDQNWDSSIKLISQNEI